MKGTTDLPIRFDARRVVMSLTAVAALLLVAHLTLVAITVVTGHDSVFGLVRLFDLDLENNVPSFFSGGLFLLNAQLLWMVGVRARRSSIWPVLAIVFVFLAIDEMFAIHERLVDPLRAMFHTTGVLHFPWFVVYAGPVLAVAISFLPTWRRLEPPARVTLMVSASLYLFGAVGMETESVSFRIGGRSSSRLSVPYHVTPRGISYTRSIATPKLAPGFSLPLLRSHHSDLSHERIGARHASYFGRAGFAPEGGFAPGVDLAPAADDRAGGEVTSSHPASHPPPASSASST